MCLCHSTGNGMKAFKLEFLRNPIESEQRYRWIKIPKMTFAKRCNIENYKQKIYSILLVSIRLVKRKEHNFIPVSLLVIKCMRFNENHLFQARDKLKYSTSVK